MSARLLLWGYLVGWTGAVAMMLTATLRYLYPEQIVGEIGETIADIVPFAGFIAVPIGFFEARNINRSKEAINISMIRYFAGLPLIILLLAIAGISAMALFLAPYVFVTLLIHSWRPLLIATLLHAVGLIPLYVVRRGSAP